MRQIFAILVATVAVTACKARQDGAQVRDTTDSAAIPAGADINALLTDLAGQIEADLQVAYADTGAPRTDALALADPVPAQPRRPRSQAEIDQLRAEAIAANARLREETAIKDKDDAEKAAAKQRLDGRLGRVVAALGQVRPDDERFDQGLDDIQKVIDELRALRPNGGVPVAGGRKGTYFDEKNNKTWYWMSRNARWTEAVDACRNGSKLASKTDLRNLGDDGYALASSRLGLDLRAAGAEDKTTIWLSDNTLRSSYNALFDFAVLDRQGIVVSKESEEVNTNPGESQRNVTERLGFQTSGRRNGLCILTGPAIPSLRPVNDTSAATPAGTGTQTATQTPRGATVQPTPVAPTLQPAAAPTGAPASDVCSSGKCAGKRVGERCKQHDGDTQSTCTRNCECFVVEG